MTLPSLHDLKEVLRRSFLALCQRESRFSIQRFYNHRSSVLPYDDTVNRDEYQAQVYELSEMLFKAKELKTVCDYGCGSGFKLRRTFHRRCVPVWRSNLR